MGLKTLDLKDVAKNLILYSQFSSHTMLKFKVSTLCNSLLSHLFSFNWGYIWSFKNIFKKWLKGLRNICIPMAEHWRIEAFELWCWRRLFWVPWTARRSNQPILKETSPGHSLEGLMLRLKLQYVGPLMQRVDSLEKTLILVGIGGKRRRGQQRMRWLDGITDSMELGLGRLRELVMDREALVCCDSWGCKELDTTEWLNWTELNWIWL